MKPEKNEERRRRQQKFLLTFFEDEPKYQEQEVNGYWLTKSFNGSTGNWQISIYEQDAFKAYKKYNEGLK